jgi:uncharacterized delta-60 repeat protein
MSERRYQARFRAGALLATALALSIPLLVPSMGQAKPGDLDRSFGGDGKVRSDPCEHGGGFASIAIDSHQRIVAAGTGNHDTTCLSRTRRNGRPDRSFRAQPVVVAHSVALDGRRIVVAGAFGPHGADHGFDLARNKPNGSLDPSFGGTGHVMTDFGDPHAGALSVAVDSHHRVVAAGYTQSGGGDADFALARFKWNGNLDSSFGSGGKVTTDLGTNSDYANSVAIGGHGRIVVGGGRRDFELARYNSDGTLDSSFGTGGEVTTGFGPNRSAIHSIAIDSRGRIVVAGVAGGDFALARYGPSGRLALSFSRDGRLTTHFAHAHAGAGSVSIDSRRRIVAVGGGNAKAFALVRYMGNGRLDRSFGGDGKVNLDSAGSNVWSGAIDSRDRIDVVASHSTLVLARFIGYRRLR